MDDGPHHPPKGSDAGGARGRVPFVVGIAGGSGSGKSTIAATLGAALGPSKVVLVEQDAYYRDLSHLAPEARARFNFDHPDALDLDLLVGHVDALVAGEAVDKPRYDFAAHVRRPGVARLEPRPVVLVEGILVLAERKLRQRMDLKVFVDTDADLRVIRRIRRDIEHRGRTFAQVRAQYYATVRPMHLAFVEPSKRHADVIIPEGGENRVALDLLLGRINEVVRDYRASRPPPPPV